MRSQRVSGILALLLAFFTLLPFALHAQNGTLTGRVVDGQSGAPVVTALVTATNESGRDAGSAMTNLDGRYQMALPAGTYSIAISAMGYGTQGLTSTVQVVAGGTVTADLSVARRAFELAPVVVSVGRTYEKALTAPAHVEVVSDLQIQSRPTFTPVDHLRSVPGVDVITQGVQSTNVVVRGFNNIFSGALHTLTDNRIAGVPSLRVNVMSFVPTTDADIERMEVVLGPGAALYGPNTANGVLHMITRSPLGESGSSVSVMGGERSALGAAFRTSQRVSDRFGVKLSGSFLRAEEWVYVDPTEAQEQAKFASNMDFWRQDLMRAVDGIDAAEADRRIALIGNRDYDIERWGGELRADWAMADNATAIFSAGLSSAGKQIELTGLGAGQVQDWRYSYLQARLNWDRMFAQVYLNQSNAGETYLLRNGAPIVDRSTLLVAQVQRGASLGTRQRFTYGIDFLRTNPETEGTINGIYEDDDQTTEVGAYLQSETQLTSRLNLVIAGRIDDHSALPDQIFSPRAALVFEPVDGQVFRLTFNRAFSTPSSLNQFLDLGTAMPASLAGASQLGYSIRVQGTGTTGFQFQQPGGGYLMRSPFTPAQMGGPATLLPAQGLAFWGAAVQVVAQQAQLPAPVVGYLLSLQPTPAEVGTSYSANPTSGVAAPISTLMLPKVSPIREETQSTIELGYKGLVSDRFLLAADLWYSQRKNLVTPLTVQTPFVTLTGADLQAYLVPRLVQIGVPQANAQAIAAGMASVPLGVISSADVNANGAQLLTTYTNVGDDVDLWGADLSATYLLTDQWSLSGSASFVNENLFETERGEQVFLNAAKTKGSVALNYRNQASGLDTEVRLRFSGEYPASSGVYAGTACLAGAPITAEGCVDAFTLLDLNLSYRLPMHSAATLQVGIQNAANSRFRSFPGVPEVGRMGIIRLRYDF